MQRKVRSRASAIDTVREPVQIGRAQEVAWPFSRRRDPQAVVAQPRGPPITGNAMPVARSVGCLGGDERRDRIAGREGLVERLVLVVAFVLLAVLAVRGGFGRTVAVVLGRELLAIAVVAHCGAPVFACPILEPRPCPGACCAPWG